MRKTFSALGVSALLLLGSTVHADIVCGKDWDISVQQNEGLVQFKITEETSSGPGCDLVVKSLNYISASSVLLVELVPAEFCPLDSIVQRQARFAWSLPYELKNKGQLKIAVNGLSAGAVQIQSNNVTFEGRCQ